VDWAIEDGGTGWSGIARAEPGTTEMARTAAEVRM
jgi:hypothetical protein